jgi:hypothetical protein
VVPSWGAWLGKRALVILPALALAYGVAWAAQGSAPFFPSSACPDPSPSDSAASPSGSSPSAPPEGDDGLSLSFGFQPDPLEPDAAVGWNFSVTNVSQDVVTMTFPSGQDGDVVLSQNGEERYRWSAGRFFTQAVRTVELAPSEAYHFTLEDTLAVAPGSYDLTATLASEPAPTAVVRTVTIGEPSATGASESPAPSGSPDPTDTPTATPSPSPEPAESATPSPDGTASPSPLFPFATPLVAGGARGAWRRRRFLTTIALALALLAVPFGQVRAQEDGSGGKNVVLVINETDDRLAARAGLLLGRAGGPTAVPENLAAARASCTDCRTVAVAFQAVLIISDPDVASPRNAAVAVNGGCVRCETFAYAWQYVVTTGGPVRVTPEGEQEIADLRAEASSLAASDLPFPELVEELDQVATAFRAVVDQEVERVGGSGVSERALDVEADPC